MPVRAILLAILLLVLSWAPARAQDPRGLGLPSGRGPRSCKLCNNAFVEGAKTYQAGNGIVCEDCWLTCTKCGMAHLRDADKSVEWGAVLRLCKTCYERCLKCGIMLKDPRRGRTCEDCLNTCSSCNTRIYDGRSHQTDRGLKCDACFNKNVRKCDVCGKALDVPGSTYYFYPGHSKFTCLGCNPNVLGKPGYEDGQSTSADAADQPAARSKPAPPPERHRPGGDKTWLILGGLALLLGVLGALVWKGRER